MLRFIENDVISAVCFMFLILIISYLLMKTLLVKKKLPPGPSCLPIVGYVPFLGTDVHETFSKLSKKYGSIFSLYLGRRYVVVLEDFHSIKEAFSRSAFSARPPNSPFNIVKNVGLIDLSGEKWQLQRRFLMNMMRNLGFNSRQQNLIKDEIAELVDVLHSLEGKPTYIDNLLLSSVSNNISSFIFGQRFKYGNSIRNMLDRVINFTVTAVGSVPLHCYFPWMKPFILAFAFGKYASFIPALKAFDDFIIKEIKEHKKTLDSYDSRDFMDGFITEINKRATNDEAFNDEMLLGNTRGIFGAGSESVRTSLCWIFLILAAYPHVQRKIQSEIDKVIGRGRTPSWEDNKDLLYTQAVLMEISRWKTTVPIIPMHYTEQDTVLDEFDIPKGTIIIANLWAVHNDPTYWKNPDKFNPERFLDDDGKTLKKSERLMPFAIGKRSCPGEMLAQMEIFLYTTHFLQSFNIIPEDGATLDLEGISKISFQPKPQRIKFVKRE